MTDCPSPGEVGVWVTTPASEREPTLTHHIKHCQSCTHVVARHVRAARPGFGGSVATLSAILLTLMAASWWTIGRSSPDDSIPVPSVSVSNPYAIPPPDDPQPEVDLTRPSTWPADEQVWTRQMLVAWAQGFSMFEPAKGARIYTRLLEEEISDAGPRALLEATSSWDTANVHAARDYLDFFGEELIRSRLELLGSGPAAQRFSKLADQYFGASR